MWIWTAFLIETIRQKDLPSLRALLDQGASPNAKDATGTPALVWAVKQHQPAILGALLEKGSVVDASDNDWR